MAEIWKTIPHFPHYEVSDTGRVRSFYKRGGGNKWMVDKDPQRVLSSAGKYPTVRIKHEDGNYRLRRVHQLVLEAFVGPCPTDMEACHNDGVSTNNSLDNLRYDTHKANAADALQHKAWSHHKDDFTIYLIRTMRSLGVRVCDTARLFRVPQNTISAIATGETYSHLGGPITRRKTLLTPEQANKLRADYSKGVSCTELSKRFGISLSYAWRIAKGERL